VFGWGFYAHKIINKQAVFLLPNNSLFGFFKKNIEYISENAINPDKRRYILEQEAPRHYIDLDSYSSLGFKSLPKYFSEVKKIIAIDTLNSHGILPWHIATVQYNLTEAFKSKNQELILKIAADLGHYVADAHVPLHTTHNYDGQFTNQKGIHALWETRVPELFSTNYDFLIGKAEYIKDVQKLAWQTVTISHNALDSVFAFEKTTSSIIGEELKYSFEERNLLTTKVYSREFTKKYSEMLDGQVERQLRNAIQMVANLWYTSWIEAGQPDLTFSSPFNKENAEEENNPKIKNERFLESHNNCSHFHQTEQSSSLTLITK